MEKPLNALPWNDKCLRLGLNQVMNHNYKTIKDDESLLQYCSGCKFIEKCHEVINKQKPKNYDQ